jgi:hypothetical protein
MSVIEWLLDSFFIGSLVGIGCRLMVLGPGLGTLLGTLATMPMCALWAHVEDRLESDR